MDAHAFIFSGNMTMFISTSLVRARQVLLLSGCVLTAIHEKQLYGGRFSDKGREQGTVFEKIERFLMKPNGFSIKPSSFHFS
jgi:hypothetical protein